MNTHYTKRHLHATRNLRRPLLVLVLASVYGMATGQVTSNKYVDNKITVKHKNAKWYGGGATEGGKLQITHESVETIYVYKGTDVTLSLPSKSGSYFFYTAYQRWYNYETDGTFETLSHSNDGDVFDLLTPSFYNTGFTWLVNNYGNTCYRTLNGYLAGSLTGANSVVPTMTFHYPTDEDYNEWFDSEDGSPAIFEIACDVSSYTDFSETYEQGADGVPAATFGENDEYWEPTLMGRTVFRVVAMDEESEYNADLYKLTDEAYQGGGNTDDDKYLEEYEISYPFYRISNQTDELVTLAMPASSYVVPGDEGATVSLDVSLASNSMNISLVNTTVEDDSRIIYFGKFYNGNDNWWDGVADGSTATILVTKEVGGITYNIARYKLTFTVESTPMTQHQVALIGDAIGDGSWWGPLEQRRPDYMKESLTLVSELDFDYDTSKAVTYGYKIWRGKDADPEATMLMYPYPLEWDNSNYLFFDGSMWKNGDFQTLYNDAQYHADGTAYYNDCSPQYETYCITSGYCSQPEVYGNKEIPTIPAVQDETLGKDPSTFHLYIDASDNQGVIAELPFEEPFCPGSELIVTAWIKSAGASGSDDAAVMFTIVGIDDDGTEEVICRHCSGQICATTWLTSNAYNQGFGSGTNDWFQIYFSFQNPSNAYKSYKLRVENYCASTNGGDFYLDEIKVWVKKPKVAVAQIEPCCTNGATEVRLDLDYETIMERMGLDPSSYASDDGETASVAIALINLTEFDDYLTDNSNPTTDDIAAATEASAARIYASADDETGAYYETLKFYCCYEDNASDGSSLNEFRTRSTNDVDKLSVYLSTDISPYTTYMVLLLTEPNEGDLDGDWSGVFANYYSSDACAITAEFYLTATTELRINGEMADPTITPCAGQTYHITPTVTAEDETVEGVYFDWFQGTEEEYTGDIQDALLAFRSAYPDAEEITDDERYSILASLVKEGKLILHQQYLDLVVSENGIRLVIQPIQFDADGEVINEDACWGYVTLMMECSGSAPYLNTGFADVTYPDNYVPGLRLGLTQITTDVDKPITVYLRDIDNDLALVEEYLYLVETNDPAFTEDESLKLNDEDFYEYSLPIGTIKDFYATNSGGSDNLMRIYFLDSFLNEHALSEGYYYTVVMHFKNSDDEDACDGSLPIEIKVVPEYLIWQGNRSKNWNNDDNWAMVEDGSSLLTYRGEYNVRSGYVPMQFSKVVMPEDSEAELYIDGFIKKDNKWEWEDDFASQNDVTESPTKYIMYDLMVYDKDDALTTGRYRVNICDQIHFEPGAMMLHPELLEYEKAWTDVKLPNGSWTLVSTPLQGVVSGDWYTKSKTGTETEKYFTGIEFDEDNNDRLDPMVFQRSWGTTSKLITGSSSSNVPAYASTGWTSVYNDASVEQTVGEGFSIKAYGNSDKLIFRFPKEDDHYDYYGSSTTVEVSRTNAGKFMASTLVTRNDINNNDDYTDLSTDNDDGYTVNIPTAKDNNDNYYCIVGNPFTANLSLKEFFTGNTDKFSGSYWFDTTNATIAGSGSMSTLGDKDVYIDPYSAFFAEVKSSAVSDDKLKVTFTKVMQTLDSSSPEGVKAFSIKAQGTGGMSGAALAYVADASDGYDSNEDVILMQDDSWSRDDLPLVYTVAGDKAVSINRLKGLTVIPLGVFSSDNTEYTLTFTGVDFLDEPSLYDAEEDTETPLTEGFTLDMRGASHGRYFIRTTADVMEEEDGSLNISAYSTDHRSVTVSSSAEIERVEVYSVGGTLQRRVYPNSVACTIDGIESGVAVVSIHTSEGSTVRKIIVM